MKYNKENEAACIAEWKSMLSIFHEIDKSGVDIPKRCDELIGLAKNSANLTGRQTEGILARCENLKNGTYGNTKTDAQMNGGKSKKES